MEIIVEKGCGLDVHKKTVVACIAGSGIKKEIRTYSTMTNDLIKLKKWLQEKKLLSQNPVGFKSFYPFCSNTSPMTSVIMYIYQGETAQIAT